MTFIASRARPANRRKSRWLLTCTLALTTLCSVSTVGITQATASTRTPDNRLASQDQLKGTLSVFDWCAFSACGGAGDVRAYKDLVLPYLKLHPGVHIAITPPPASSSDWVIWENTVLASGQAPSLISPAVAMQPWSNSRWYAPLNSLLAEPDPYVAGNKHMSSLFDPVALQEWNDNGNYYSLEFTTQDSGLFYNPAIFAKAGITTLPTTWAELLADCAKVQKIGAIPVGFDLGDTVLGDSVAQVMAVFESNTMQPVFNEISGSNTAIVGANQLVKAILDGRFSTKSPGFTEAWKLLKTFSAYFEPGAASYTGGGTHGANAIFARGNMGMLYLAAWEIPILRQLKVKFGFFPLPQLTKATWPQVTTQYQGVGISSYFNSWPWSIPASSVKNGGAALADNLLQWLAVPKNQATFAADVGNLPATNLVAPPARRVGQRPNQLYCAAPEPGDHSGDGSAGCIR